MNLNTKKSNSSLTLNSQSNNSLVFVYLKTDSSLVILESSVSTVRLHWGQFTCPKGHLGYAVRDRVRVSVKFRNLHNSIWDK